MAAHLTLNLKKSQKCRYKRILIFTSESPDSLLNSSKNDQILLKLRDFSEEKIDCILFNANQGAISIDSLLKPRDLVKTEGKNAKFQWTECFPSFDSIHSQRSNPIFKFDSVKSQRKRVVSNCVLKINDSIEIAVKIHSLIQRKKPNRPFFVNAENNAILKSFPVLFDRNGNQIDGSQVETFIPFVDHQIPIGKEEISAFFFDGKDRLELIGFASEESLRVEDCVRHSLFLSPSEKTKGSTHLLRAVIQSAIKTSRVILCKVRLRKFKVERFAALLPAFRRGPILGENDVIIGMNLIFLPYSDDLRDLEVPECPREDKELLEWAEKIVLKMRIPDYSPENVPNPNLERFFSVLEAHALEEELVDETDELEKSFPGRKETVLSAKNEIERFESLLELKYPRRIGKRKRAISGENFTGNGPISDENELKELLKENRLDRLTVSQLKEILGRSGQSKTGRKAELIERVESVLNNKSN